MSARWISPACFLLLLLIPFDGCTSRPPTKPKTFGAEAVVESRSTLNAVAVVDIATRDTLYRFTRGQIDSLKIALGAASISEGLLSTPPPWDIALVLHSEPDSGLVALYYGDVLRVNSRQPWSPRIADSAGAVPGPGIADIVLNGDDVSWIYDLMQQIMGVPPSKSHRARQIPQVPNPK